MSDIPSRDYFNVFIKTRCNCNENECDGNHTISYRSNNNNVILLHHNTKYIIGISNNHPKPVLAVVTIDGMNIGKFRINEHSTCLIKIPLNINKELIFVDSYKQLSTLEALSSLRSLSTGRIQVSVLPAAAEGEGNRSSTSNNCDVVNLQKVKVKKELDIKTSSSAQIFGGTILGQKTSQKFIVDPYLSTCGKHVYTLHLRIGNLMSNIVICEEFSPSPKSVYNPDEIYESVNYRI